MAARLRRDSRLRGADHQPRHAADEILAPYRQGRAGAALPGAQGESLQELEADRRRLAQPREVGRLRGRRQRHARKHEHAPRRRGLWSPATTRGMPASKSCGRSALRCNRGSASGRRSKAGAWATPGCRERQLTRNSHQCHGLRGAVRPTGQERRAARCGASGERLGAPCRPESAALRVAPRRPSASCVPRASRGTSRASTVVPATLFGPLLADRTPGRDAGRDIGEKSGLTQSARPSSSPSYMDWIGRRGASASPTRCSAATRPSSAR